MSLASVLGAPAPGRPCSSHSGPATACSAHSPETDPGPGTLSRKHGGSSRMKITRVQTLVLTLPMLIDGPTPMLGGRPRTSIDMLLVRIDTDGGITGWGEAFGHRDLSRHARRHRHLARAHVRRPRPEPDLRDQRRDAAPAARDRPERPVTFTRCPGSTSRSGTSRARRPAFRSTGCWAAARAPTCPPTRAFCATAPPTPSPATPSRRWGAATGSSSCTRSPCPR